LPVRARFRPSRVFGSFALRKPARAALARQAALPDRFTYCDGGPITVASHHREGKLPPKLPPN